GNDGQGRVIRSMRRLVRPIFRTAVDGWRAGLPADQQAKSNGEGGTSRTLLCPQFWRLPSRACWPCRWKRSRRWREENLHGRTLSLRERVRSKRGATE